MRRILALALFASFTWFGLMASSPIQAKPADSPDIAGTWKLVLMAGSEIDFAIFEAKKVDGKLAGKLISSYPPAGPYKTVDLTVDAPKITIQLGGAGDPLTFRGSLDKEGNLARGSLGLGGGFYPARVEKTTEPQLAEAKPSPFTAKLNQARAIKDPKEQVARLRELAVEVSENPANASLLYAQMLSQADAAGLSAEDVGQVVAKWIETARPYGPELTTDTESKALKALQGKKAGAALATEMALAADKALPADASTDQKSQVATMLATSAKLAGKAEIAAEAEGRVKTYEAKLDAEYHEKVPPFKPEHYAGRTDGKGTRVVLMEIFTGAECPPCVAADVAFDALLETFKPTEFIGLQHHLHIPRSDPLTNLDTIARQAYYGTEIRGTPSTFFNGKVLPGGGGPMSRSEIKYKEYRQVIDPALKADKLADITLTAKRNSDEMKIVASAKVDASSKDAKPRLRLVLVEESVRYPGGNKLRFHENVVRAFPGGVAGKELEKGEGTVEVTVKLSDLLKGQAEYLEQYSKNPGPRGPFSHAAAPMDLDDLAVVAFVQDDADHSVWHAIQVPVKVENP